MAEKAIKFDRVVRGLYKQIENGFEDKFAENVNRIQKLVGTAHRNFFKRLVVKAIDKRSAPRLGEYTPVWKQLNPKYRATKQKQGQSTNFFMRTGELKTTLQSLDPKSVLGAPVIYFTPSGLVGTPGVGTRLERWKGQASKRRVIRDSKGRFASATQIPRVVKASIKVDAYPKILEDIRNEIVDERDYFDKEVAEKLRNPKGKRLRPIITNYLNWYLDTEITKAVARAVK